MRAVPLVVGETEMKGELPPLFSSKTGTHWGGAVWESGVEAVVLRGQAPLPGPGVSWCVILCCHTPLGEV